MHDHPGKDFFLGAMIGSTLGALTALALTTKKGHKIQKELINKYHEFDHAVRSFAQVHPQRKIKKAAKKLARKIKRSQKAA